MNSLLKLGVTLLENVWPAVAVITAFWKIMVWWVFDYCFFLVWIGGFGLKTNCFVCILQNRSRVVGRVRRSWCTSKVDRTWNEFTWAQLFTLGERPKWSHSLSDEDDPLIRMCYWRHTVTTLCQLEVERREGKVPQLLWQHWWESFVWWPLVVAFCFVWNGCLHCHHGDFCCCFVLMVFRSFEKCFWAACETPTLPKWYIIIVLLLLYYYYDHFYYFSIE